MILVREANPLDFETIAGFQIKMARETEGIDLNPATVTRGVKQVFAQPSLGRYFIAETDGKVVASLLITYEWSDWRNGTVFWIQSVYVSPPFRKKGVFRCLYDHIRNLVREDDSVMGIRLYVDKANKTAKEVYRRMGMDGDHYALFEWMK